MSQKARHTVEAQLDLAALSCSRQDAQLTELRRSVFRLILEAETPLTAYQLLDRLKEIRRGAVPPTIYRALDFLLEQRLVHKVERLNAFIPCSQADHHHDAVQFLICRQCGTVAEIESRTISKALEQAAEDAGFRLDHAMVEVDGTCSDCRHPS